MVSGDYTDQNEEEAISMPLDARQFYWMAPPFEEQPLFRAPEDVVAGWMEIANQACSELRNFGLPATVLAAEDRVGLGGDPGGQVIVCNARPFGVILAWEPPLRGSEEFKNAVLSRSTDSPLLKYIVEGKELMSMACIRLLAAAGFTTAIEGFEGSGFTYRILFTPRNSVVEYR
ncbi:hypothetical protein AB0K15_18620 [Amycolatopsis sp. NPDC049253]|uniref:hypothetical protein n=1 Tax=Amycolatopsis sp. NPDC049253 TaxID=3155274 RepID=UPI00344234AF